MLLNGPKWSKLVSYCLKYYKIALIGFKWSLKPSYVPNGANCATWAWWMVACSTSVLFLINIFFSNMFYATLIFFLSLQQNPDKNQHLSLVTLCKGWHLSYYVNKDIHGTYEMINEENMTLKYKILFKNLIYKGNLTQIVLTWMPPVRSECEYLADPPPPSLCYNWHSTLKVTPKDVSTDISQIHRCI